MSATGGGHGRFVGVLVLVEEPSLDDVVELDKAAGGAEGRAERELRLRFGKLGPA
jgi:hypothetical protein